MAGGSRVSALDYPAPADLNGTRSWSLKSLSMHATKGGAVQFSVGGSTEALSPEGARRAAAHLLALADLAEHGTAEAS
jgi:hypothetical protein